MRLINTDLLEIETQSLEDVGQGEIQFYSVEQIDNAPTVDAIPREKIDKMVEEIEGVASFNVTNTRGKITRFMVFDIVMDIIYKYCVEEKKHEVP